MTSEYQVKLQDGIPSDAGSLTFELPDDLPEVGDDSVWYLRLNTYLPTAPQVCHSLFIYLFALLLMFLLLDAFFV